MILKGVPIPSPFRLARTEAVKVIGCPNVEGFPED